MEHYTEPCESPNPCTVVFLVDQSGSMEEPFGGSTGTRRKADVTADALNRILDNLIMENTIGDIVKDRFHVAIIGYGEDVGPALEGSLAGQRRVTLSALNDSPLRTENRKKKEVDETGEVFELEIPFTIWIEPKFGGLTPMKKAFELAKEIVAECLDQKPKSYPPMVINITDGLYTPEGPSGDPTPVIEEIQAMANENGSAALVFNCHISNLGLPPLQYPASEDQIEDNYAKELFRMSSVFPTSYVEQAQSAGFDQISEGSRGFVFNADAVEMVTFLKIGTLVKKDRSSTPTDRV